MAQTTIDQFYQVTASSKKFQSLKNNTRKFSSSKSPAVNKKKGGQLSSKSKASACVKCVNQSPYKRNKRQTAPINISLNNETPCSSRMYTKSSPIELIDITLSPTTQHTSPIRAQQRTPVSRSGSKFTPKTSSPIKMSLNRSPSARLTRRKLFKDRIDDLTSAAIDNLNLVKEGAISSNDINLEKVYSSRQFNYKYNPINTAASTRYEIDDVIKPTDTYSQHFFLTIVTVFSNPINCGYFDPDELDLIFSLLTLSRQAQALLIRMVKRKNAWQRVNNIKYDEISTNLKPIFDELVSRSIFISNTEEEDLSVLLKLLKADEIRELCRDSKINGRGKKDYIQAILKFCSNAKSLFPGMPRPAVKLRALVDKRLGDCVILNVQVRHLIDRIITLLMPDRDPTETLADSFFKLFRVETNEIKFPETVPSKFPIFASKRHLLDYVEARNTLSDVLSAIVEKEWETVRKLGYLAEQRLSLFLEVETQSLQDSVLPYHIRRFLPGYTWLKVQSKCIDAFKKTKETMPRAKEYLRTLIDQDCHMKNRKGQWYNELLKIEMYHMKNLNDCVELLLDATSCKSLTRIDRLDLLERAKIIVKRKYGISQCRREAVKQILDSALNRARLTFQTNTVTKVGTLVGNTSQRKSCWRICNGTDELYGTVENLAIYDYKREGYSNGVHCEGAFPITLFGTLFWDEIYNINIPGANVSPYQEAPLDLYSPEFYNNRKERIDAKIHMLRMLDSTIFCQYLKNEYDKNCHYMSIVISQGKIFDSGNYLQELAYCLGVEGVIGICERLIFDFALWKAGFPDLIVWNANTKEYKIVEVKGPGDSLSTKQKLWLEYLAQLGLNTEVCHYESSASRAKGGRKRKHDEIVI